MALLSCSHCTTCERRPRISSTSSDMPEFEKQVEIWVRSEPLRYHIFPVQPAILLSLKYLKKMVPYIRGKSEQNHMMSYKLWKHIACYKLGIPEELAWAYFESFTVLNALKERVDLSTFHTPHDMSVIEHVAVNAWQFVVYLYQQSFFTEVKNLSVVNLAVEVWPMSPNSSTCLTSLRPSKSDHGHQIAEESYQQYVLDHLDTLLQLLCLKNPTDSLGPVSQVPLNVILALDWILGSQDEDRIMVPLHDLLSQTHRACETGYIASAQVFNYNKLVQYVCQHLRQNPYGVIQCAQRGDLLPWLPLRTSSAKTNASQAHLLTNRGFAPPHLKLVLLSSLNEKTIGVQNSVLSFSEVVIRRSSFSYIYLLSSLRSILIEKCHSTTLVLGPIATFLKVVGCQRVLIHAICHRIVIRDCSQCVFHLLTPTHPVLAGNNTNIKLAPFVTTYPQIDQLMQEAGVNPLVNLWDRPLCISSHGSLDISSPCWQIIHPSDIRIFKVPFVMERTSLQPPNTNLPAAYQVELLQQESLAKHWDDKTLAAAGLDEQQRKVMRSFIQRRFRVWLATTGKVQELHGLSKLLKSMACVGETDSTNPLDEPEHLSISTNL